MQWKFGVKNSSSTTSTTSWGKKVRTPETTFGLQLWIDRAAAFLPSRALYKTAFILKKCQSHCTGMNRAFGGAGYQVSSDLL